MFVLFMQAKRFLAGTDHALAQFDSLINRPLAD
jgi:hypothetical protein